MPPPYSFDVTDWHQWHDSYADQNSSLSRRLRIVQHRLDELVSGKATVRRVLSLCAGDGRDILPVIARQPETRRPHVVLVELDPDLAAAAERRAADAGVAATVLVGDAGAVKTWQEATPIDLLMLCGIFGNIGEADVQATIGSTPGLLNPRGSVIWTRGFFDDNDLRPQIRQWFTEAGFEELAFDAEPRGFGVGVNRLASGARATPVPDRLFSFVR